MNAPLIEQWRYRTQVNAIDKSTHSVVVFGVKANKNASTIDPKRFSRYNTRCSGWLYLVCASVVRISLNWPRRGSAAPTGSVPR